MSQFAIRCHPCSPVVTHEVEGWLSEEVHRLRDDAPHATLRLMRLSQLLPSGDEAAVGWLLECESDDDEPPFDPHRLESVLRDLRLLGLQPTVLSAAPSRVEAALSANGAS